MKCLQTFDGEEGFIREGAIFEVDNQRRASLLEEFRLAERIGKTEPNDKTTNEVINDINLTDKTKTELVEIAKGIGITGISKMTKDELVTAIEKNGNKNETDKWPI